MNDQPKKPKISIIAVNWWGKEFVDLLIESVVTKAKHPEELEVVIVDNSNSIDIIQTQNLKIIKPKKNLGHGEGLNLALSKTTGKYVLALDIDAHILLKDWDEKLIDLFETGKYKLLAAEGGWLKPIRPLLMFFKKRDFVQHHINFRAQELNGAKFDVSIQAYFKILTLFGDKSVFYFKYAKTAYKDVLGNEYSLGCNRLVYHNWYATRWFNIHGDRVHDEIDNVNWEDFEEKRKNLFNQIKDF